MLSYFREGVVKAEAPASEEMLRHAEGHLDLTLPPSMKQFLLVNNGLEVGDMHYFGVPSAELARRRLATIPLFDLTTEWNEVLHDQQAAALDPPANAAAAEAARRVVAVAEPRPGDVYVLLAGRSDGQGEYPVGSIDHETNSIALVASSYERFLWFSLDRLTRWHNPDGEFIEDLDPHDPLMTGPWMSDFDWMRRIDPGLAAWTEGA